MLMEVYRITQEEYANDLSGNGARLFGGRWNSEGFYALYVASSRSLALLETLAHTPARMLQQKVYMLVTIAVPDKMSIREITISKLGAGWDVPDIRQYTQKMGNHFLLAKNELLLAVPSVLVPEENNYVLNPLHTDFKKVKVIHHRRIGFDKRMESNL